MDTPTAQKRQAGKVNGAIARTHARERRRSGTDGATVEAAPEIAPPPDRPAWLKWRPDGSVDVDHAAEFFRDNLAFSTRGGNLADEDRVQAMLHRRPEILAVLNQHADLDQERLEVAADCIVARSLVTVFDARRPVLVHMSTVEPEAVTFLWEPYIPAGKLTLLEGDPGIGKSWVAVYIAAAQSRGWPLPSADDGKPGAQKEPRDVLFLDAENGLEDTLRPRLDRAGADVARVHVLTGWRDPDGTTGDVSLADVSVIEDAIVRTAPSLLIVDPLQAFLGARVDMHRANEVRPVLKRLAALAERYGVAVLCIRHLSKAATDKSIYRGMGSIDFFGAARSALLAGCDPQDKWKRALVHHKSNCVPEGPTIGYELRDGRLMWTGKSDLTAGRMLSPERGGEESSALDDAREFLREHLDGAGAVPAAQVQEAAKVEGIAEKTLRRAGKELGVRAVKGKGSFKGGWTWELPPNLPKVANTGVWPSSEGDAK